MRHARWAKVVISVVTDAAVEMLVFHRVVAVVAEDDPGRWRMELLWSECQICVVRSKCEAVEEV